MNTKQVIVVRKDLNMRKGKMVAQGCHASNSFLTRHIVFSEGRPVLLPDHTHIHEMRQWLQNSFKKVTVSVSSEEELLELHQKCLNLGLVSHLITDNGATEFNGVSTNTCIAIGPHEESKFIGLTDHLPLL